MSLRSRRPPSIMGSQSARQSTMPLQFGQLVYTSFAGAGFKALVSPEVPEAARQVFLERLVYRRWDAYNPMRTAGHSAYICQPDGEQSLFGWLYGDGKDEMNRSHVPYFLCYYLAQPLEPVQLDNIFNCLAKGPVQMGERLSLPVELEPLHAPDLWNYQPAGPGVIIPTELRAQSHTLLKQGQPLDLFFTGEPAPAVRALDNQTCEALTRALARHVGPMAIVIVRQAVARSADSKDAFTRARQVCEALVTEVEEPLVASAFRGEVEQLLKLDSAARDA